MGVSIESLVGSDACKVATAAVGKADGVSSGSLNGDGLTASVTPGTTVAEGGEDGAAQLINANSVTMNTK